MSPCAPPASGRRERKKAETRRALFIAALDLFTSRGIAATTVEEITEVADVSPRTFHRHFTGKEEVLFFEAEQCRVRLAAFLRGRPPAEAVLESLRAAAHELAADFLGNLVVESRRLALLETSDTLWARHLWHTDQLSSTMASFTSSRLQLAPTHALPRLLAACTAAAVHSACEARLVRPNANPHSEIDHCFQLVADLHGATTGTPRSRLSGPERPN